MKPLSKMPFYALGLFHHLFTAIYSCTQIDYTKGGNPKIMDIYRYNDRYLTSWNMGLQIIYFTLALVHEIIVLNKSYVNADLLKIVHKVRGYFFISLILPCGLVVTSYFWIFYLVDKNYILPVGADEVIPSWVNHSIHTNILFLPFVELVLPKLYTPSFRCSLMGVTIFTIVYNAIYFFTYFHTGKWIYPLFEILNWPQRILLFAAMYITSVIFCKLGIMFQKTKAESYELRKTNYKKMASVSRKLL